MSLITLGLNSENIISLGLIGSESESNNIVIGVNSWATLAEADSYLTFKAGAEDWFSLSDSPSTPGADSKETFLISAFYWLLYDSSFPLTAALTDNYVKIAQIEAAIFLLTYREDYETRASLIASGVTSFKNSKWDEDLGTISKPVSVLQPLEKGGYFCVNDMVQLYPGDY